jgi:hypothetical protein
MVPVLQRDDLNSSTGSGDRLTTVNDDLTDSTHLIEVCLKLLEDPQALYLRCDDDQRRILNQAIFHRIDIEEKDVVDHQLQQPFARLHDIQTNHQRARSDKPDPGIPGSATQPDNVSRAASLTGDGPADASSLEVLLGRMDLVQCSSKPPQVEVPGIEPGSFDTGTGLLRVQPARRFLGPGAHAGLSPTGSAAVWCPCYSRGRDNRFSLLAMPGPGPETLPG